MRRGGMARALRAPRYLRVLALVSALGVAGCAAQPGTQLAAPGALPVSSGVTITFDSIDGPPPDVFRKLVASLNDEAQARKIPVVSRDAPATYRVRGYVSAAVERNKTSFNWVWDIYDADKRRTLRVTGEEPAGGGKRRDAWTAADDPLLRRMAADGMDRIAAFLSTPGQWPAREPETPGITLAAARGDDTPESAGIFRATGAAETTGSAPTTEPAAEMPPPAPKRTKPAKRLSAATTAAALAPER